MCVLNHILHMRWTEISFKNIGVLLPLSRCCGVLGSKCIGGSEHFGLRKLIKEKCHTCMKINHAKENSIKNTANQKRESFLITKDLITSTSF